MSHRDFNPDNVRCGGVFSLDTPEARAHAVAKLGAAEVEAMEAIFREEARHLPMVKCRGCAMQQAKAAVARGRP